MPTRFLLQVSVLVVASIFMILPATTHAETFNRQLQVGMRGTDVSALQTFLAQDNTLYPQGLITGYFGYLTKSAVSNFQSRNGIPAVGRVGPQTLPVLNLQYSGGGSSYSNVNSIQAPTISGITTNSSRNSSQISWYTNENAKGVVYYSTSPLTTYEDWNSVTVSGNSVMTDANFHTFQNVNLQNLQPNTTYYYLIYSTNQAGGVSVTWPTTFQTSN